MEVSWINLKLELLDLQIFFIVATLILGLKLVLKHEREIGQKESWDLKKFPQLHSRMQGNGSQHSQMAYCESWNPTMLWFFGRKM
jgi:hypothetical protein